MYERKIPDLFFMDPDLGVFCVIEEMVGVVGSFLGLFVFVAGVVWVGTGAPLQKSQLQQVPLQSSNFFRSGSKIGNFS
mgnify:CR=1 FL=1